MTPSGRGISILIADDDPLALKTLTRYFEQTNDLKVVATARDGVQALAELDAHPEIDIILADIHMPRMNGLTLLKEIAHRTRRPKLIAITAIDDEKNMLRVLGEGGSGYILKSQTPLSIVQSVRDAVHGGMVVSPNAAKGLIKYFPHDNGYGNRAPASQNNATLLDEILSTDTALTEVEKQVLELLCQGKNNADIAKELSYSESSIKKYVSRLMVHFGASSRLDLVVALLNRDTRG